MNNIKEEDKEKYDHLSWQDTLPPDWTVTYRDNDGLDREIPIGQHPVLAKYPTKNDAVKALVHAQRLIGKRHESFMQPPTLDSTPEERDAFFAAMGRPDHADDYELPDLELPDHFELDEDLQTSFRHKAHELGLTADQVRGLYEWFLPLNFEAFQDLQDDAMRLHQAELDSLRHVHRGEFGTVVEQANQAVLALGGEELLHALTETGAGNKAAVVNAFARMAPCLLEGSLKGRTNASPLALTEDKLMEMMKDPRYHDPTQRDPNYVRQIREGFERLFPGDYQSGTRF